MVIKQAWGGGRRGPTSRQAQALGAVLLLLLLGVLGGAPQVALVRAVAGKQVLAAAAGLLLQGVFRRKVCGCRGGHTHTHTP